MDGRRHTYWTKKKKGTSVQIRAYGLFIIADVRKEGTKKSGQANNRLNGRIASTFEKA
jgi:hypothetical protein